MSEQTTDAGMPAKPEARMSGISRLTAILFSPAQVFEDIARKPTWLLPLALGMIVSLAVTVVMVPKLDIIGMLEMQMEQAGRDMSPEQIEQSSEFVGRIMKVMWYIAAVFGGPVLFLIIALVYWAIIRIGKGTLTYVSTFCVVCWSSLPWILKSLITGVALLRFEDESILPQELGRLVPSSPGWFLAQGKDPEELTTPLIAFATSLDVFSIWAVVLTIIGLTAVSSWSRGKCAGLVLIIWGILIAIGMGFAALSG